MFQNSETQNTESIDTSVESAARKTPRSTTTQKNEPQNNEVIQKYLRGERLEFDDIITLRNIPITEWTLVSQTIRGTESPFITFAYPPDHILRVTLLLKNSKSRVLRNVILSDD